MMICPACNRELSLHDNECKNCGAPAYLAVAAQAQAAEFTHCTYCGARHEQGEQTCPVCGLKKHFKTSENLIGTCRNCGEAWRNVWMYCQTCGIARGNGLVDASLPATISFPSYPGSEAPASSCVPPLPLPSSYSYNPPLEYAKTETAVADVYSSQPEFDLAFASSIPSLLSETEVVERMYANGKNDARTHSRLESPDFFNGSDVAPPSRATFFSPPAEEEIESDEVANEPEAATISAAMMNTVAHNGHPFVEVEARSAALPSQTDPYLPFETDETQQQATELEDSPVATHSFVGDIEQEQLVGVVPATESDARVTVSPATSAATKKTTQGPVQSVRVLPPPSASTPPIDKNLVKLIVVLILLILLFSALIVSGVRLSELFSSFKSQSTALMTEMPMATPSTSAPTSQAPEGMVYIPGGTFRMGVDNGDLYESPAHEVTVPSFFMDRTEVTNAQYAAFLRATGHAAPPDWNNGPSPGTEKRPVVNVSWQDALDYANWAGKRLPTEAEWEYAAKTSDNRRYPWGADWDPTKANTRESNLNQAVDADSYVEAANPFGLLHMAGNVWEWVVDDVTSYKDASLNLAPGKVIRGGAFYTPKERATTTCRSFTPPDKQAAGIGFRCVKDAS